MCKHERLAGAIEQYIRKIRHKLSAEEVQELEDFKMELLYTTDPIDRLEKIALLGKLFTAGKDLYELVKDLLD